VEDVDSSVFIDALYETLIEQSPLGIAVQTPDRKVVRANRAFCEMFGYSLDEVVGKYLDDLVAPDEDLAAEAGAMSDLVLGGKKSLTEKIRMKKDGSRFPVAIWGVPIIQEGRVLAVYAIYQDISERKAAERDFRRESSLLERVLADSPDGMILFDDEGIIFRTNPAFDCLFDLEPGEALGHPVSEILGGGDKEKEVRERVKELREKRKTDYDGIRFRKDGSEIHLSIRGVAIAGNGPSKEYLAIYRDITPRVRAQQQLATERAYFENLFMNSPLAIALILGDGIIQRVNESFERLFGYSSWECVGMDLDELIAPGEPQGDAINLTRGAAAGSTIKAERTRRRKDGSWVEVQINAVCFPVEDDQKVVYAIYQDITAQKVAERALKDSEAKYRELFDSMPVGFYTSTSEGYFLDANPAFIRMLGYDSLEELSSLFIPMSGYIDKDERERVDRDLCDEKFADCCETYRLKRKDGQTIWVEDYARYIKGPSGEILFNQGLCLEITDRLKAEEELKRLNKELYTAATTDMTTGLFNRKFFDEDLRREMDRASRYGSPLSLVMIDLDNFKVLNDTKGHMAGDSALQEIAQAIKRNVRSSDTVARWGGDEFVISTPTDTDQALSLAGKLRGLLLGLDHGGFGPVTGSIGVSTYRYGDDLDSVMKRADLALYKVKQRGGNGVSS
jgi:diguanylate cyclase (GGDEF)-like protein/PAS domain S-box-containing protein